MSGRAIAAAMETPDERLNLTDRLIFAHLVARASARVCWRSVEEIMATFGIGSRHTVCNSTAKLEACGLIRKQRHQRGKNHYHILDPDGRLYGTPGVHKPAHQNGSGVHKPAHQEALLSADCDQKDVHIPAHPNVHIPAHQIPPSKTPRKNQGAPPLSPQGEKRGRKVLLPCDWEPKDRHFELGSGIGLSPAQVLEAAQQMREKMAHTLERGADWDTRFAGWLRGAARLGDRQRASPKTRDYAALLRRIEAGGDEPSRVECAA